VGLIDWDPETGIASSLYKPEPFKLLSDIKHRTAFLDITLRAGVMFPQTPRFSKAARTSHDVELIVLEILNAKNFP